MYFLKDIDWIDSEKLVILIQPKGEKQIYLDLIRVKIESTWTIKRTVACILIQVISL